MSLDPHAPPASSADTLTTPVAAPAIENEIPAYRAISPLAVSSLILGLLSVLCFASLWFLVVAAAAIVLGTMADRKIRRLSDVLTGRGLAQAGIALGLAFSLSAVTVETVQSLLRRREAEAFARRYLDVLKSGSLAEAMALKAAPIFREDKTAEELLQELEKNSRPEMVEEEMRPIRALHEHLAEPGTTLTLEEIETNDLIGLDPYVTARLRLEEPAGEGHPAQAEYALLVLKATNHKGRRSWWVNEIVFPYQPKSHVVKQAPVDDGHGHAH